MERKEGKKSVHGWEVACCWCMPQLEGICQEYLCLRFVLTSSDWACNVLARCLAERMTFLCLCVCVIPFFGTSINVFSHLSNFFPPAEAFFFASVSMTNNSLWGEKNELFFLFCLETILIKYEIPSEAPGQAQSRCTPRAAALLAFGLIPSAIALKLTSL